MTFPFSVHFNRVLKTIITSENSQQVLHYIKTSILEDKADHVIIKNMSVTYKGSTSVWRGSLFRDVDNGVFNLIYKDNCWILNYQINMRQLFIATSIMSAIMEIFVLYNGGPWWVGIAAFSWLCGLNWITIFIRHGTVATDIAFGIDNLFCEKEQISDNKENDESLKSWF